MLKTLLVSLLAVLVLPTAVVFADSATNYPECDNEPGYTAGTGDDAGECVVYVPDTGGNGTGGNGNGNDNGGTPTVERPDGFTTGDWRRDGTVWRLYINNARAEARWHNVGGVWTLIGAGGVMQTGWQTVGGNTFYLDGGAMVTGLRAFSNNLGGHNFYFFDAQGRRQSGVRNVGTHTVTVTGAPTVSTYQFFGSNGRLETGWRRVGTVWSYFTPVAGREHTGLFLTSANQLYYANERGVMQTGWINTSGADWVFANNNGRIQANEWVRAGRNWFFVGGISCVNTNAATNVATPNVACNHTDAGAVNANSGRMSRNAWLTNPGGFTGTFRTDDAGRMQTGWYQVDGEWFNARTSGVMRTGWRRHGGNYYFLADATVAGLPGSTLRVGQMVTASNTGNTSGSFTLAVSPTESHIFNANGRWLAVAN